jgi:S-adenosylmethionine synthetase
MTEEHRLISAESVTEGHPDKVCDQISDAILDDLLAQDSSSHVAVETSAATGVFLIFGEVTSKGYCDVQSKVRETLRNIGYTSSEVGLDADSCGVVVAITEQSAEINQGVARLTGDQETAASREERYEAQGAGDQGVMFGYATDETPTLMPLPIYLAHRLAFRLTEVRKSGEVPHLRPDGKTQVTIEYDDDDKPVRLDTVLISTQHDPEVTQDWLAVELKKHVIDPVLDEVLGSKVPHDNYRQLVNPTGSFILGGPAARSSSTPTVALPTTAVARSPARTRPRSIVPPRTPPVGLRRTSWLPAWPTRSRSKSPTLLVLPTRYPSTWRPSAPSKA